MISKNLLSSAQGMLAAGFLAVGILVAGCFAQSSPPEAKPDLSVSPNATATDAATTAAPSGSARRYQPSRFPKRANLYFEGVWGVDSLSVKAVESGEVIRFTWRVIDPEKAKMIHDKKFEPSLIDLQAGVSLVVPSLEKVGQLRQASTPEAGRSYWMAFSNKGRTVKRGDRVDVVIGQFRASGLMVE